MMQIELFNKLILENIFTFSAHKFASNVVLKFLEIGSKKDQKIFISNFFNLESLVENKKNKYTISVLIKCIDLMNNEVLNAFKKSLSVNIKYQFIIDLINEKMKIDYK